MTTIQKTIAEYLRKWDRSRGVDGISLFTLDCFVGMIETGEATFQDFETVTGGIELSAWLGNHIAEMEQEV